MIAVTVHILGHPDYTDPQTFVIESGQILNLKPEILARARKLSIKVEDLDAEKKTSDGGEASQRLDFPSPVRNS